MANQVEPPTDEPRRPARQRSWALLVGVLVVGLVVGGVLGAVVAGTADDEPTVAAPPPAPPPAPSAMPPGSPAGVPEPCLRALDAARQVQDTLEPAGRALAELDAARLDEIVRRLQVLQQQVQAGTDECRAAARAGAGSTGSPPPPAPPPGG